MKNYVICWLQYGKPCSLCLHTQDTFEAVDVYLVAGCEDMTDCCSNNRLYCNGRLVARQAIYQGV